MTENLIPVSESAAAKFAPDGTPRRYPGNTITSHPASGDPAFAALARLVAPLKDDPRAGAHVFLPAQSYHMTLFRGVNDRRRNVAEWPRDLPLDMPLADVTEAFATRLAGLRLGSCISMRPEALEQNAGGEIRLRLAGTDAAETARLERMRATLAAALDLDRTDGDARHFHITLSYRIRPARPADEAELAELLARDFVAFVAAHPVVNLHAPALCTYEDMLAFCPYLDLS